jgi:hypothetical protein
MVLARMLHKKTIQKSHSTLLLKSNPYKKWSSWKHAKKVQNGFLGVYSIFFATLILTQFQALLAAPDLLDSWDFSTPSSFTIDDGLQTNGTSLEMKPQNYTPDAQTAALFHFDETGGTVADDSSSNNNNGTVSNGGFSAGRLFNGLELDSTNDFVSVPDSPSLSLSQSNTLEAWTKLANPLSSSSEDRRQAILDKGDYQLYYDNETGKVTYELANSTATSWSISAGNGVKGSWDTNRKRSVSAGIDIAGTKYIGLGNLTNDAEVWSWNGTSWTKIGGDNVNDSWDDETFEDVYSMATDGTHLYVGLGTTAGDGEVWMWDGASWTKIGGDSINSSWQVSVFETVWSLNYFGGTLYAGLGSSGNDAEVWSWNGTSWTKIGGDSLNGGWTTNYEVVRSLHFAGGILYAGLGLSVNDAELWSWDGAAWTTVGGDGLNGSWDTNYEAVYAIVELGGDIFVGLGASNGDGEVWRLSAGSWAQIGGDNLNGGWTTNEGDVVQTLLSSGSSIFAGTYDTGGGGYFFEWNGTNWQRVGGQYINDSWGFFGQGSVEVLQNAGEYLYAGIGATTGSAQIWRYDDTEWEIIGGQGINGSWEANTYEQISSISSHAGNVYVGLGTTANDGEVWMWNGTIWSQIGGDSLNGGWETNFEEVNALASFDGLLYAGLGNSNSDAEVWTWDGTAWTKIGGDNINGGWPNNYDRVSALTIYGGQIVAGLGAGVGEGELWTWDGTAWTKIGGDDTNGSWDGTIRQVEALIPYNNKLYVGLGNQAGQGDVWTWDGTAWEQVGGDSINDSWTDGTYERVRTLAVYNGDLYAGLGSNTGEGEVWRLQDETWSKVAGNSQNNSWANTIEEVESFSTYKGKLYAGTGNTANADGFVWSYGDNGFLQSTTDTFDTQWRHIAASYDGSTMRVFINGTENASTTKLLTMPNSNRSLLIGNGYGGREYGKPLASFNGLIDEVRISSIARSELQATPYLTTPQTATLASSVRKLGVAQWDAFSASEQPDGGSIRYRISDDEGATWKFWDGAAWTTSASLSESNPQLIIDSNIEDFPVTFDGITWQAILESDGNQNTTLESVAIESTSDAIPPTTNATNITAEKTSGGDPLAENDWTNSGSPYFTWDPATDGESTIVGYCAYLGQDNSADPLTTAGLLGASPIETGGNCQFIVPDEELDTTSPGVLSSPLTSSSTPYYLTLKAIDGGGNISASSEQFAFRFDNTPATNPGFISTPSGFVNNKAVTITWPTSGPSAPSDNNSGLAGLQYNINDTGWYGDSHTGTGDSSDLLINDGEYSMLDPLDFNNLFDGINTIEVRTWDVAGNVTTSFATAVIKLNTSGSPSEPRNVQASPTTNVLNAFSFSWEAPTSFIGDANNLTYCYTINTVPSESTCSFTSGGSTSLGSGPYATQPGENTFYVAARDESNNINYAAYTTTTFTANTPAPGIPLNVDIVDVSIKSTSNWRLALTWEEPTNVGAGITTYRIYRSTDNGTFTQVGTSSSTTYIDAGLSQIDYFYHIRACDSTNNCGAESSDVSEYPTGKFTSPAIVTSEPSVTNITTKKAQISWSTDRVSDSRVAIGTSSGVYSASEIASSEQVTAHTIQLDNLSASTTYYFVAKWTDEDGNTGTSQEYTFVTAPAPTTKEVSVLRTTLTSAVIEFTSRNASKVDLLYGVSESYGGITTINTATTESTYTVDLTELSDGSKYFFKIVSYDAEGNAYDGSIFSFVTPPRPRITNLRFQPIDGEPTSTQSVTWQTNVPSTTTVTYGKIDSNGIDALSSELVTEHEIIIRNLEDASDYFLVAQSRDADGNLAVSDRQVFRTALDTRPPKISDIVIETTIRGTGAEARGQVIVSWRTDEPATSQVAYGEGSSTTVFNSRTAEDDGLGTEHIVVVSDLPTSRVYNIQPLGKDRSGNEGIGDIQTAIIGRSSDSVLTIILNTLQNVFGF